MLSTFVKGCLRNLRSHRERSDGAKARIECNPRAEAILRSTDLGVLLDGTVEEVGEYNLERVGKRPSNRLIGIEVWTWGRFANAAFADINAISAAAHLGLECVVLCEADGFTTDKILDYKGMKIYSSKSLLKAGGCLLRGPFWDHVGGWPRVQQREQRLIARWIIRYCLERPDPPGKRVPDELAIHIRGGDVFSGDDINPVYVQPPLAFYRNVVRIASTRYGVTRVRIVAEDRQNPCLAALEDHLRDRDIPFVYQSLSLTEDFASLLDVKHLAYGVGTFGPAVCLMSDGIESVFSFLVDPSHEPARFPWIDNHHGFFDAGGAYIKQGEWRNEASQRRQMLEYPDDAMGEKHVVSDD